jgi:cephalosporin-C deacetylase
MCLRLIRAVDVITQQPEWNGRHVAVLGVSQGGLQALAAAGLDERVTFFSAGVAAGCDHAAAFAESPRVAGWPKLLDGLEGPKDVDGAAGTLEAAKEASRYFDCVNFATRIKCPGVMTVGFIDGACPPSSVYAAYNALTVPKRMIADPLAGHANTPEMGRETMDAVRRHFAATAAGK